MQGIAMIVALAISSFVVTDATRTLFGNGRASVASAGKKKHHHHKHFFEMLLKDFEKHPKDKGAFNKACSKIVGELYPELREEYTEIQVPQVLRDSCEAFKIKEDFRRDDHKNKLSEPVLARAQVQCKFFAGELSKQFSGKKEYGGWCTSVFQYLTDVSVSPKEVARRIKERNIARVNLQKIQDQWEAFRDLKGKAWFRRNKFNKELAPFKGGAFDSSEGSDEKFDSGAGEEDTEDAAEEEEAAPLPEEEKEASEKATDEAETDGDDDDDGKPKKCCPKGCKVCSGFNLKDGVVHAQLAVTSSSETQTVKMMKTTGLGVAAESDDEVEADEDSESDEDLESDEDSEEDSEEEAEDESDEDEDDDEADMDEDDDGDDEDMEEEAAETSLIQRSLRQAKKVNTSKLKKKTKSVQKQDLKKKGKSAEKKVAPVYVPAAHVKAAHVPVHLHGGFYYLITQEFKRLPKTEEFTKRCVKVISKLMPDLREEYTWKQVPNVLKHDCEVYATKTDFKTDHTKHDGGKTCKFFAKRLSDRFKGDKNYKEWCLNVYSHLLRESGKKDLTDVQKKLLKEKKDFSKEIYNEDNGCCPANCKMC